VGDRESTGGRWQARGEVRGLVKVTCLTPSSAVQMQMWWFGECAILNNVWIAAASYWLYSH